MHRPDRIFRRMTAGVMIFAAFCLARQTTDLFRVGYEGGAFSEVRLKDVELALEVWTTSLGRKLADGTEKVSARIYKGAAELEQALRNKEVDLIVLGSHHYCEIESKSLLDPALVPSTGGKVERKYYVLVRKEKGIDHLREMRGLKLLAETGGHGALPLVWLEAELGKNGMEKGSTFFSPLEQVDKPSQAVLPVFFGQADACLVNQSSYEILCELNPQLGISLEIIVESPRLLRGMVCFRHDFDGDRAEVLDILTNLHKEPEGQQTLLMFHEERLVPFRSEFMKNVRSLYQDYVTFSGRGRGDGELET